MVPRDSAYWREDGFCVYYVVWTLFMSWHINNTYMTKCLRKIPEGDLFVVDNNNM